MTAPIWTPSPARAERTQMGRFARAQGFDPGDYEALWRWSVADVERFWDRLTEFCGVRWTRAPEATLRSGSMPDTRWFPGGELSYADHLLGLGMAPDAQGVPDRVAVVTLDERGVAGTITRRDLTARVGRLQAALRERGIGAGDRVAALLPNRVETLVALLAADSLGAVFSSCSPDFGAKGILDRFGQIAPKVLIAGNGHRYNGTVRSAADKLQAIVDGIPALELVVMVDVITEPAAQLTPRPSLRVERWDDVMSGPPLVPDLPGRGFDDPLAILYSSGTTGPPKSIVHCAGGTLVKHLCEQRLHCDIGPGDVVFWYTTCGWMMWNWLVSALASDATIVLYDGSPSEPDLGMLWRMAADLGVTHFGTSPKFLASCAAAGVTPAQEGDLSGLRAVMSTGAPLHAEQFDWVYASVGADVQLASISGGTDIIGCFAAGVPTIGVRRGELQGRVLGMAVESWENGRPTVGRKGELVCTKPFPSMPIRFWGDADGSRYHDAYFSQHPGVWTHGDFIEITPEGGVIIYGRSDTTLNPGGVRIGTAELYRAIEGMPEVADAVVVGRPTGSDTEIVLFVVLRPPAILDDDLRHRIRDRIRGATSPRHVPRHIAAVREVPYTISGKKVEKAVLHTLIGQPVHNRDAIANPEALADYAEIRFPE